MKVRPWGPAVLPTSGCPLTRPTVNGHIESRYSVQNGKWSEPRFIEDPILRIHGLAPGINYGNRPIRPRSPGLAGATRNGANAVHFCRAAFVRGLERRVIPISRQKGRGRGALNGRPAFRNPSNEIQIFRPTQNAERMIHSTGFISIPPVPKDLFVRCVHLAVALNAGYVPPHETGASMYIRPLVFGSCAQLGLNPPDEYTFVVYVMPVGVYHGTHPVDALILEDFDRAAPEGTGSAKLGGNYAPVLRWSEKASKEGYGITLHLDSKTRTEVDEFSTSGFVGIKKEGDGDSDYRMIVPDSKNIIKSVTSESVFELATSFGWKTERRPVRPTLPVSVARRLRLTFQDSLARPFRLTGSLTGVLL